MPTRPLQENRWSWLRALPGGVAFLSCLGLLLSCDNGHMAGVGRHNRLLSLAPFAEGLAPVQVGGKLGYIDKQGQLVIPATFDQAGPFRAGRAVVSAGGAYAWIDKLGARHPLAPRAATASAAPHPLLAAVAAANPTFEADKFFLGALSEGRVAVSHLQETPEHMVYTLFGYADATGKLVIPLTYADGGAFSEGLAAVRLDTPTHDGHGLVGYIDPQGRWALKPAYASGMPFRKGRAWVSPSHVTATGLGGPLQLIDRAGKQVSTETYNSVDEVSADGLTAVSRDEGWGYADESGRLVVACRYLGAATFSEGRAAVMLDDARYGYIDTKGALVYEGSFNPAIPEAVPSGWAAIN